jgi:hypothetical protein
MANIESAIVIDDDEDDHDHEVCSKEEEVQMLMEILNTPDRSYALSQLRAAGFDLQLALSRTLDSQSFTRNKVSIEGNLNSKGKSRNNDKSNSQILPNPGNPISNSKREVDAPLKMAIIYLPNGITAFEIHRLHLWTLISLLLEHL